MSGRILCIGEAMVELSAAGELWRLGIAGDTLNTAWYLRGLLGANWRVGYLSRVGMGDFSQKMLDFLHDSGIAADYVSRDPLREIGLYAISLRDGERSFSYWRDNSAARRLADDPAALAQALDGAALAYFSGITLAILPPAGRAALLDALAAARARGTQVVFDPNLRPRLWEDAGTMRASVERAAALCDLILPSFDDESAHFGDADPPATIARYLRAGARQVVVKAGGGPVHLGGAEAGGIVADLPRVQPRDTTAAGDSFNAGYLAARLAGADPAEAVRHAHALSLRVIAHPGALVPEALAPQTMPRAAR